MERYAKFITAVVAMMLIGLNTFFGLDFGIEAEGVYPLIVSVVGAFGVFGIRNGK